MVKDFNNYYGVAKLGSLTSTDAFIEFAQMADIQIEHIDISDARSLGFNLNLIDSLWSCREAVIDIAKYKSLALEEARAADLTVTCRTEVTRAFFDGSLWQLFSGKEPLTYINRCRIRCRTVAASTPIYDLPDRQRSGG